MTQLENNTKHIYYYLDLLIRIVAGISLIPLAYPAMILGSLASDSPSSGIFPGIIVFGFCAVLITPILVSCVRPDIISERLVGGFGKYDRFIAIAVGRAPAYICAFSGLYFGLEIFTNFTGHIFR
jgi:hypothetical protein